MLSLTSVIYSCHKTPEPLLSGVSFYLILENNMNGYPRLYIGKAAQSLRANIKFPISYISKENYKEVIEYYSTIPFMKDPLVLDDISLLSSDQQTNLLKFIEDSPLKIILVASEDNVIPTILSRVSLYYKGKETVASSFQTFLQSQDELDKIDKDSNYFTYLRKQQKISPITYYYDSIYNLGSLKAKVLQLLEG